MKTKFLNLGLVICLVLASLVSATSAKAQTTSNDEPPPVICTFPLGPDFFFWSEPSVPSIFDKVTFGLDGCNPPGTWVCDWDFGDGTTANSITGCFYQYKQYNADGDYTARVQITDGENSASISQTVPVRTHDVAITKFSVPQSASARQTRQITVYVRNTRYPERIQVELYKNDCVYPPIGTLIQDVPPRSANRTTAFNFSYTFTAEDARIGKVTFRAMAFILDNGGDDWQVDNNVTAFPTRVSR